MVVVGNNHKIKIHIWRRITFGANNSHVLGCPSSRGVGAQIPVSVTMDSIKYYIDMLEDYLTPTLTWYFGDHAAIYQQDNAPRHL